MLSLITVKYRRALHLSACVQTCTVNKLILRCFSSAMNRMQANISVVDMHQKYDAN